MILNGSLLEQGTKRAIAAALNRTASDMKKEFIRVIQRKYGLTAAGAQYVADTRMRTERATPQNLKAIIKPTRRVVPLIFFNAQQDRTMPGTSIEIVRGEAQILAHTFIPQSKSGQRYISPTTKLAGVYKRIGSSRPQKISLQGGVPFRQMFSAVMPEVDKQLRPTLQKNLEKEITKTMK